MLLGAIAAGAARMELILLLKLDEQFPVEQFEAAASQRTVPSPPLEDGHHAARDVGLRLCAAGAAVPHAASGAGSGHLGAASYNNV